MVFQEEHDGQFSFFTDVEEVKVISPDITFVTFMKEEIKKFQSKLNSFVKYKNEESFGRLNALLKKDFEEFIAKFLDLYKLLPVEQILIIQENYSSEYHRLCRLFLEYLNRFVYNKNLLERLDDFEVIQIENLIMLDPVSFRDVFYRDIKGKIEKRKKLRVNHYLVIHGPALLERMNASFLNEDFAIPNLTQDVNALVYHMSVNDVFVHYDSDFIEKEQSGTLSMLLLYYLEKSVYHCLPTEDTLPRDMIEKIELYIVYHFSEQFQLLPNQEKTYEQVKMSVARRLSNYIKKNVAILKRQIKDYDTICKFQDSGKYQLVTEEAIDLLPNPVTEMELRMALETFLTTVFVLKII